jgi:ATP-dependent Clp protease adaptor protein ClpS
MLSSHPRRSAGPVAWRGPGSGVMLSPMSHTLESGVMVEDDLDRILDEDDLWAVLVWNDDVNTFDHVIKALIEILNHSRPRAEQLAQRIHNTGKAVVAVRPKEEAEAVARRFGDRGIWATIER